MQEEKLVQSKQHTNVTAQKHNCFDVRVSMQLNDVIDDVTHVRSNRFDLCSLLHISI